MVATSSELRRTLPALIAGVTVTIVFFAVLSIVLTAAGPEGMALSDRQTSGWIALVYGFPMLPSLVLTMRYRMPLLLTGNVFALIFFVSLGDRIGFSELAAASMLSGAILLVSRRLGLTGQLAAWIPAPIVHGLIAGAVMPFVVDIFSALSTSGRRREGPGHGGVRGPGLPAQSTTPRHEAAADPPGVRRGVPRRGGDGTARGVPVDVRAARPRGRSGPRSRRPRSPPSPRSSSP